MNQNCIPSLKKCNECDESYLNVLWCGELLCEKCLDMCSIVQDSNIMNIIFQCCPKHRPLLSELLISDRAVNKLKYSRPNISQDQLDQIHNNVSYSITEESNLQISQDNVLGFATETNNTNYTSSFIHKRRLIPADELLPWKVTIPKKTETNRLSNLKLITNEKKELTTTVSTSTKSTTTSTPSSISLFSKLLLPKQDCVSKLVLVPPRESDNPCRVPKSKPIVITSSISVDNNPFNTNTSVSRWSSRSLDDDAFGSRSETVDNLTQSNSGADQGSFVGSLKKFLFSK